LLSQHKPGPHLALLGDPTPQGRSLGVVMAGTWISTPEMVLCLGVYPKTLLKLRRCEFSPFREGVHFRRGGRLISSKYGPPRTLDQTTEDQCIYGNGAYFKFKKGPFYRFWSQKLAVLNVLGGSNVSTRIMSNRLLGCPANLRYSLGQSVIGVLSMHYGRSPSFSNENPF
jgi:hypothetical protein